MWVLLNGLGHLQNLELMKEVTFSKLSPKCRPIAPIVYSGIEDSSLSFSLFTFLNFSFLLYVKNNFIPSILFMFSIICCLAPQVYFCNATLVSIHLILKILAWLFSFHYTLNKPRRVFGKFSYFRPFFKSSLKIA